MDVDLAPKCMPLISVGATFANIAANEGIVAGSARFDNPDERIIECFRKQWTHVIVKPNIIITAYSNPEAEAIIVRFEMQKEGAELCGVAVVRPWFWFRPGEIDIQARPCKKPAKPRGYRPRLETL